MFLISKRGGGIMRKQIKYRAMHSSLFGKWVVKSRPAKKPSVDIALQMLGVNVAFL